MLYRLAVVGIIAFWMVMMGLLVRLETHPEGTGILDVPVSYVGRMIFQHGQSSLLTVREGEEYAGSITLHPSITGSGSRLLRFSGALAVRMPLSAGRQHFNFTGTLELDAALRVQDFQVDLNLLQPRCQLLVRGNIPARTLACQVVQGKVTLASQSLPLTPAALAPALWQNLGLDPRMLPVSPDAITPPDVTARETQIALNGEELAVYEVSMREGTAPLAEVYVSQLGQVIRVHTGFGYSMAGESFE